MKSLILVLTMLLLPQLNYAEETDGPDPDELDVNQECSLEKKMKFLIKKGIMTKELCLHLDQDKVKLIITGDQYRLGDHLNKATYNYSCQSKIVTDPGKVVTPTPAPTNQDAKTYDFKNFPQFLGQLKNMAYQIDKNSKVTGQVTGYADGVRYTGVMFDGAVEAHLKKNNLQDDLKIYNDNHCLKVSGGTPSADIMKVLTKHRNFFLARSRAESLQKALITSLNQAKSAVTFTPALGETSGVPVDQTQLATDNFDLETGKMALVGCCDARRGAAAVFTIPKLGDSIKIQNVEMNPSFNAPEMAESVAMSKAIIMDFAKDINSMINAGTDQSFKNLLSTVKVNIADNKEVGYLHIKLDHTTDFNTKTVWAKTQEIIKKYILDKWGVNPTQNYQQTMLHFMTFAYWVCTKQTTSCNIDQTRSLIYSLNASNSKTPAVDVVVYKMAGGAVEKIRGLDTTCPADKTKYIVPQNAVAISPANVFEPLTFFDFKAAYALFLKSSNKNIEFFKYMAQPVPTKFVTGVTLSTINLENQTDGNVQGKGYFHNACGSGNRFDASKKKFMYKNYWSGLAGFSEAQLQSFVSLPPKHNPFNPIKLKNMYAYLIDKCQDCNCLWDKSADDIVKKLTSADTVAMDFSGRTTNFTIFGNNNGKLTYKNASGYNRTMCLYSPPVPLAHFKGEGGNPIKPVVVTPPVVKCGIIEAAKLAVKDDVVSDTNKINTIYNFCVKNNFAKDFPWTRKKCKDNGALNSHEVCD
jgi:hypothetical protein